MAPTVAKQIAEEFMASGQALNEALQLIKESCPNDEFEFYRKAIGKVMGELGLEVLNPFFTSYPDVKPEEYFLP